MTAPLLTVDDLVVDFAGPRRVPFGKRPHFRAVDHVSLTIDRGETLGLVGESGSGKTTTGRAVLGLVAPTSGAIDFDGTPVAGRSPAERGAVIRQLQVIFQNPYSSLNPALTIRAILAEAIAVAVDAPVERDSGGQRQRVAIARALAVNPRLIVCDEPVSALDVSTRGQIVNLLEDLRDEFAMAYLFIAHDLTIVRHISHRIAVMYRGQIVEIGDADAVATGPAHPYTRALIDAVPVPDPRRQRQRRAARTALVTSRGSADAHMGCPFRGRCPSAHDLCHTTRPVMRPAPHGGVTACHLYDEGGVDQTTAM